MPLIAAPEIPTTLLYLTMALLILILTLINSFMKMHVRIMKPEIQQLYQGSEIILRSSS